MTGPTHVAIAISLGIVGGATDLNIAFIAAGALLPDLDTHQSIIGRLFLFISVPLNNWLGHRGAFHSFWLWGLVILSGSIWHPLYFVGLGAFIHVVSDCWTVSGVRAMTPFSSKLFVMFQRSWRFKTGSNAEICILLVMGTIAWSAYRIGTVGGLGAALGYILRSPKIMVEEHKTKGLLICYVEGKFRFNTGVIEKGRWLIVGSDGMSVSFLRNGKIVTNKEGKFLRARLVTTKEFWQTAKISGMNTTGNRCYFMSDNKWHIAQPGDYVFGFVIGREISIMRSELDLFKIDSDLFKKIEAEL